MTTRSEDVLYSSLTDVDALEQIVRIGLDVDCIPTVPMRQVVSWAIDYFFESGQRQAPSREALMETWEEVLDQGEIEIAEEDVELDNITWALDAIKAHFVQWKFQQWQKEAAVTIAESVPDTRLAALEQVTQDLTVVSMAVRDRTMEAEGIQGFRDSLREYHRRAENAQQYRGMTFGIPEVDDYTYGIHEGEVAVLAGGTKMGKSVVMGFILLNEWRRGRRATYYTLENSVGMTYDRLACMHLGIDHDRYRQGLCLNDEIERYRAFLDNRGEEMKDLIQVVQPQSGQRTAQWMVRHARTLGTQSLLIDQLTFMEPSHRSLTGPAAIKDIMHGLKDEVSLGRDPLPLLLAHQINREGMKVAKVSGFLEPWMLAEGAEVERTCDWGFGLHASRDERTAEMAKFQTLMGRRATTLKTWRTAFRPWVNQIEALTELEPPS